MWDFGLISLGFKAMKATLNVTFSRAAKGMYKNIMELRRAVIIACNGCQCSEARSKAPKDNRASENCRRVGIGLVSVWLASAYCATRFYLPHGADFHIPGAPMKSRKNRLYEYQRTVIPHSPRQDVSIPIRDTPDLQTDVYICVWSM